MEAVSGVDKIGLPTGGTMSDYTADMRKVHVAREKVCNQILEIMKTYHEQEASPSGFSRK